MYTVQVQGARTGLTVVDAVDTGGIVSESFQDAVYVLIIVGGANRD